MRIIGITGGVGAGKTKLLQYIEDNYKCRIIRADEAAHLMEQPGQECYARLVGLLGNAILNPDGTINKKHMADIIFSDSDMLEKVNDIIHPEVKKYILSEIEAERSGGNAEYFFIEAALLIEEHYDKIVDELWYIHTDEAIREKRLSQNRQYSAEKIKDIMRRQLSEEDFRKHCGVVITNNGSPEDAYRQIKHMLG